jgi:serine/threonine-protein kinase
MIDPTLTASNPHADPQAGPSSPFEAERQRLRERLTEQIERDALREARETVVALLCLCPNDPDALSAREFLDEQLAIADSSRAGEVRRFEGHESGVTCVAFAPDGLRAVSGGGGPAKGGELLAREDRSLRLWDIAGGQEVRRFLGAHGSATGAAFLPDGKLLLSSHRGGHLNLWDVETGILARRFERKAPHLLAVAAAPSGRYALAAGDDKIVYVWEVATGRRVRRLVGHADAVTAVAFLPDGLRALSGSLDQTLRLWDLRTGDEVRRYEGHLMGVAGVAVDSAGRYALSCSAENILLLWDLESGRTVHRLRGHTAPVHGVAFSRDGQRALSAGADHTVRLWDASTGRELFRFVGHRGAVTGVALSPTDDLRALSGGRDGTVRLWQLPGVVVSTRSCEDTPGLDALPYATAAELVAELEHLCLLDDAQQEELERDLRDHYPQPGKLVLQLLQRGWLTPYQVGQLAHGSPQGLVLDPYVVLDRIGEGATGEVYKARLQNSRQTAVLKVVRAEFMANPETARQFLGEVKALSQLNHPNVIRTFGAYRAGADHFFAMEYLEGTDLAKLVQQSGPLPVRQACEYVRQAALGLEHAHEHCLVHRDIKPANLLLTLPTASDGGAPPGGTRPASTPGAVIKVIDWGLSTRRLPAGAQAATDSRRPGEMVGTIDYLAPEQADDPRAAGIQADIYSLGCVLYHLLTGQPPFPGGSLLQKLLRHKQEEPRPVTEFRPDVPDGLAVVLRKMTAKRAEGRYRTPAAAAAALAPFCRSPDSPATP